MELWREATVNTEELLVHDGGEGKCTERLHAGIVDTLGVLALAYLSSR